MIAWFTTLWLRGKIWLIGAGVVLLSISSLWVAWRLTLRRARNAEARAKALKETREKEQAIRNKQDTLKLKQVKLRETLKAKTERDYFERGYGP